MNKILVSSLVALALFGAQIASAQAYYPSTSSGSLYAGACVSLSRDLSYGSKGSDVSQLQNFLVAQNYPGGGSWMVTGYFGSATLTAVRDFQQAHGLSMTGVVDASTRAAISQVGCGTSAYNYNWNSYTPTTQTYAPTYYPPTTSVYPYNYNYNSNTGYNSCGTYPYYYSCTNYGLNYGSSPTITSLSPVSGVPGTPVTVFGNGFDYSNNNVYVGGTTLSGIPSVNGTSLVFTIPANVTGSVSVTVGNSHGTSNAITFSTPGGVIGGCGSYPYTPCPIPPVNGCGYGYSYTYCPPINNGLLSISYLSPSSGGIGATVTVYGSGFSARGNSVHFGNGVIANLSSFDGTSLSFTVPTSLSGYGYQPIGLGTYNVSVANSIGATSNALPFTITSLGTSGGTLSLSNISGPNTLALGQTGTWSITLNNLNNTYTSVNASWGDTGSGYVNQAAPQTIYSQGTQTITFTHAYFTPGTYTITFTAFGANNGQQNSVTTTVTVTNSGTSGTLLLSTLSPSAGVVGTQVMLQGSGFDALNNTIHFGVGGTQHVPSVNGTTIYYTIPAYVSPCDVTVSGNVCAQYIQQVTPGSYQLYVTNSVGTSQILTFQVQ